MNKLPPLPLEDSPGFTEEEAQRSEPALDSKAMVDRIGNLCCRSCGKRLGAKEHALKRLHGVHYSRVTLTCEDGHTETRIFRLDWLKATT
jgi:hypothetical protein